MRGRSARAAGPGHQEGTAWGQWTSQSGWLPWARLCRLSRLCPADRGEGIPGQRLRVAQGTEAWAGTGWRVGAMGSLGGWWVPCEERVLQGAPGTPPCGSRRLWPGAAGAGEGCGPGAGLSWRKTSCSFAQEVPEPSWGQLEPLQSHRHPGCWLYSVPRRLGFPEPRPTLPATASC